MFYLNFESLQELLHERSKFRLNVLIAFGVRESHCLTHISDENLVFNTLYKRAQRKGRERRSERSLKKNQSTPLDLLSIPRLWGGKCQHDQVLDFPAEMWRNHAYT